MAADWPIEGAQLNADDWNVWPLKVFPFKDYELKCSMGLPDQLNWVILLSYCVEIMAGIL